MTSLPSSGVSLGTPLTPTATRAMLLGSGELGKEVVIELQRLGVETIAVDRYPHAPAHQVAHRAHVLDMQDADALRRLIAEEQPDLVIPEIEAIATPALAALETESDIRIVPTARATVLTMDREGIRRLAAETLGLPTSPYRFVDSLEELEQAVAALGLPAVVKPVMSSSGHGQSVLRTADDVARAWDTAQRDARGHAADGAAIRCIVEGFVDFDEEIAQLTVVHASGTVFLDPVHHRQVGGDYAESWQHASPSPLSPRVRARAQEIAAAVTGALGGWGLFGVELFVRGEEVIFSEVSPRPHDTGLVTLVSQDLSEFALHARAVLGLPVSAPERFPGAAASVPIKVAGHGVPVFENVDGALAAAPTAQLRLFGKPRVDGERRVGVALARGRDGAEARARAQAVAATLRVRLV